LGIQTKDDNTEVNRMVDALNDADTVDRTIAERAFLARLEGGCQVPIGAYATLDGDTLHLDGLVGSVDGKTLIRRQISGARSDAKSLGIQLADTILDLGAREILAELYETQGHG
jgi:hydroxymethylbilane synthase